MAEDRRADAHDRRAFVDGDLEVLAHAHRQFRAATRPECRRRPGGRAVRAAAGTTGATFPDRPESGGIDHQAAQPHGARVERRARQIADRALRRRRTSFPRAPDRPAAGRSAACPRPPRRRRSSSAVRGDRRSESTRSVAAALRALLDCRWPMRCHSRAEVGELRGFVEAFLHAVFAEMPLAGGRGGAHVGRRQTSWRRRGG